MVCPNVGDTTTVAIVMAVVQVSKGLKPVNAAYDWEKCPLVKRRSPKQPGTIQICSIHLLPETQRRNRLPGNKLASG